MSGQSSKWKEEQILIVCPGSRTTMAQLGCGELTPPAYRIPTRMFRDEEAGAWRPYRTWKRKKQATIAATAAAAATTTTTTNGESGPADAKDDEWEYVEDPDSDEGAVYPMEGGYIVNMEAFLAFLEHVHGLLTTTYHNTPIVLMTSPQWTRPDCEAIALYVFEKTRTPALCMINSALATQYGLKWPHMTVVDIGFEKVDVTCIYDSRVVNHMAVGEPTPLPAPSAPSGDGSSGDGSARAISGGEVFTRRLQALLRDRSFTYEMAEQLKKSPVCEVLPYAPEHPKLMELPEDDASAAPAATAAAAGGGVEAGSGVPAPAAVIAAASGTDEPAAAAAAAAPSAPAVIVDDDALLDDGTPVVAEDGVLDVATIVTSGQTKEFLAKKEKERSERGRFGRRGKDKEAADAANANKPLRLPNAKRARVMFHYEELVEEDEATAAAAQQQQQAASGSKAQQANGSAAHGSGSSSAAANGKDGSGSGDGTGATGATANGKSHGEDADGSDEGDEGSDDEDEDDEDEGEGEEGEDGGAEAGGDTKPASAPADSAAPAAEGDAPQAAVKEEAAAATAPESKPDAAPPASETQDKPAAATDTPKETPDAPAAPTDTAPADPAAADAPPAAEDTAMEDAPAAATDEATTTADGDVAAEPKKEEGDAAAAAAAAPAAAGGEAPADSAAPAAPAAPAAAPAEADTAVVAQEAQGRRYKRMRRDFEIGLERFTFADRAEIDRIVTTIYRTVQGIEDMYMRPPCWENLVFVGNGCRLRGLRENILQTLHARHLISPSTATMFTSELPSNLGTPSGTGAQTPTGMPFGTPPHQLALGGGGGGGGVNPLLQAATTASLMTPGGGPGSTADSNHAHQHHFHSQTPTAIKLAALPTYLSEWTKNGFEEAMFLGAQVAARLAFCVHNLDAQGQEAQRQMSLTRVDYNELGPKGIRTHAMLG